MRNSDIILTVFSIDLDKNIEKTYDIIKAEVEKIDHIWLTRTSFASKNCSLMKLNRIVAVTDKVRVFSVEMGLCSWGMLGIDEEVKKWLD